MTHHPFYERLLARSDELTEPERERLLAHLGTCERCRREQRVLRAQDESLRRFAAAQLPMSRQTAVLAHIRTEPIPTPAPASRSRGRLVPVTAGLLLAACLLMAVSVALGQHFLPHPAAQTAVAVRGNCTVAGASWALKGPCQVVSSPDALRTSGVTVDSVAVRWAQKYLRHPQYVIRRNDRMPIFVRHSGAPVYFSEVAKDQHSHQSVYVVGEEE